MVTIKQIADVAGVSTTTVSNVIHGKTRKVSPEMIGKIQSLIDEMGYVQPMGLSVLHNKQSHMIAVIVNRHQIYEQSILNDPFYATIIGYIEEELQKLGYYMMFFSADNVDNIFTMVKTWNVDGAILVSMSTRDSEKISHMVSKPVVCIDPIESDGKKIENGLRQQKNVGYICLDDAKGGYLMTKHLIELGYKTIYICGAQLDLGVDFQRMKGAKKALQESGKVKEVELLPISSGISYPERERFYEFLYKKIPFKKKTALFCTADRYALEANSFLQEKGVVIPDDMGLTGFDGISYIAKYSYPRLTTIRQNVFYKAQLAVEELVGKIENPEINMTDHVLDVSLVIRQSAV